MSGQKKAVFLDRDGTIIENSGCIGSIDEVIMFTEAFDALKRLQNHYELFVVTNQSGIGKGFNTAEEVAAVNAFIDSVLRDNGIIIKEWYVCPHDSPDNCECKKPKPYFLNKARDEYGIDLKSSWVIGDHPHDIEFAENGGAKGLYVLTGHGVRHLDELPPDVQVFHNLTEAAARILGSGNESKDNNYCSIEEAANFLRSGGLVAFPTETVYGLGADVFNPGAAARIFELKGRPLFNPLIAHISDMEMLDRLVSDIGETALRLAEAFWPGPLTIVFNKRESVPDIVTGGSPTVAVRMPSHPMALELIRRAGTAVAAPSANAFGRTSPTTAAHVVEQLGSLGYKIIDGGACRVGVESTVLSLVHEQPMLLRPGGLAAEDIEKITGPLALAEKPQIKGLESPGMLASHYSPLTPFVLKNPPAEANDDEKTGLLLFEPAEIESAGPVEILSRRGSTEDAAVNLYAAMRRLDRLGLERIIAYRLPERGLGKAVNDRMKKAATPAEPSA